MGTRRATVDDRPNLDGFSKEWLFEVQKWIHEQVRGRRLPNDFPADLLQDELLRALQDADPEGGTFRRASAIRISKDCVKRRILDESNHYRHHVSLDNWATPDHPHRLDWLFFRFAQQTECGDPDHDYQEMINQSMTLLRKNLTKREMKYLELRFMTVAPHKTRTYTIKEIADLWGDSYGALRQFSVRTLAKVRNLLS